MVWRLELDEADGVCVERRAGQSVAAPLGSQTQRDVPWKRPENMCHLSLRRIARYALNVQGMMRVSR